jgi:LPS export ABC transporter protein LptC
MVQQTKNILIVFILPFVLSSCFKSSKTMEEMKPYEGPVMELDSMKTLYTEKGEIKVKLVAKKQLELQNGNREFPEGVYVEFYEGKEISSTLTSNFARYYKETSRYMVSGNVVIDNSREGKKLVTEELFWIPNEERIYVENDKQVIITTKSDVLYGKGLEASQDFSKYKILNPSGETTLK